MARVMQTKILNTYFEKRSESFSDLLRSFVMSPTPTGDAKQINRFLDGLEERFSRFGTTVQRTHTEKGDILHFSIYPEKLSTIVLLAHVDTVPVSSGPPEVRIEGDRMFGPGSYDMKNGIALFDFVLQAFKDLNIPPQHAIHLIFTPDEETGSHASSEYLLKACRGAAAVILPEPSCPDGGVKVRRKGVASIKAQIFGKAAHSGIEPEQGKDANRGLSELIRMIDGIVKQHREVHFNPGLVSGGRAVNIVSPESTLDGELRCFSTEVLAEAVKAIGKINRIGDLDVRMTVRIEHPALESNEKNSRLVDIARRIAGELGAGLTTCATGGASDGSDLSNAGIPVIDGMSMRGGGAHSVDEFVDLSDFPFRAALFTRLIQEI